MYGFANKIKTATLEEVENKCYELIGTTFGHNMIGLILEEISNRFGEEEVDRIKDNL